MDVRRLLLNPIIKERICSNLTFEEVVNFRDALGLPSLKCPLLIIDSKTQQKLILPGVNTLTISINLLIREYGLNDVFRKVAKNGQDLAVRTLISAEYPDNKFNIDTLDQWGWTALMLAALKGENSVVQTLLIFRANINAADKYGNTALMVAANYNHNLVVQTLIASKEINVNAVDQLGRTALIMATLNGHDVIVRTLLTAKYSNNNKINVNLATPSGWTALRWASQKGHHLIIKLLRDHGAY